MDEELFPISTLQPATLFCFWDMARLYWPLLAPENVTFIRIDVNLLV